MVDLARARGAGGAAAGSQLCRGRDGRWRRWACGARSRWPSSPSSASATCWPCSRFIAGILDGREHDGGELLVKGGVLWVSNVIAFGLWFWVYDRGGPVRRREADPPPPTSSSRRWTTRRFAEPGWEPRLFDYLYVAFPNSIAFSPTDTMPLTRRAKGLMLLEGAASALTILLVAARAVNILGSARRTPGSPPGGRRARRAGGARHARTAPGGPRRPP